MYYLLFALIAIVFITSVLLLMAWASNVSRNEEIELEVISAKFTPPQEAEYAMIKDWYLQHTTVMPSREKYLEGKYDNTIDYIRTQSALSNNSQNAQDFKAIMRGVGPSSKIIKGSKRNDSSDGMPIFIN